MYRAVGGVHLGGACRFEPSCSEYAVDALSHHEVSFALKLIFRRLMKCHPWGPWGFDPVPHFGSKNQPHGIVRENCDKCCARK